jgi:hypothetical protein
VDTDDGSFHIKDRFSGFEDLLNALKKRSSVLPALPQKRLFGNMKPEFLEQRSREVPVFLSMLFNHPEVEDSSLLFDYLKERAASVKDRSFIKELSDDATSPVKLKHKPTESEIQKIFEEQRIELKLVKLPSVQGGWERDKFEHGCLQIVNEVCDKMINLNFDALYQDDTIKINTFSIKGTVKQARIETRAFDFPRSENQTTCMLTSALVGKDLQLGQSLDFLTQVLQDPSREQR